MARSYAESEGIRFSSYAYETFRNIIEQAEHDQRLKNIDTAWKRKATQRAKAHKRERRLVDRAWNQGWNASLDARPEESCPYKKGTEGRRIWLAAYEGAKPFRLEK